LNLVKAKESLETFKHLYQNSFRELLRKKLVLLDNQIEQLGKERSKVQRMLWWAEEMAFKDINNLINERFSALGFDNILKLAADFNIVKKNWAGYRYKSFKFHGSTGAKQFFENHKAVLKTLLAEVREAVENAA